MGKSQLDIFLVAINGEWVSLNGMKAKSGGQVLVDYLKLDDHWRMEDASQGLELVKALDRLLDGEDAQKFTLKDTHKIFEVCTGLLHNRRSREMRVVVQRRGSLEELLKNPPFEWMEPSTDEDIEKMSRSSREEHYFITIKVTPPSGVWEQDGISYSVCLDGEVDTFLINRLRNDADANKHAGPVQSLGETAQEVMTPLAGFITDQVEEFGKGQDLPDKNRGSKSI